MSNLVLGYIPQFPRKLQTNEFTIVFLLQILERLMDVYVRYILTPKNFRTQYAYQKVKLIRWIKNIMESFPNIVITISTK